MSKKKKDEKIAVVVHGKDVCRIIPFKPSDGRYELKFDFLGNEFDLSCYRLFAPRPIQWEIFDSNQFELTYHKGEIDKPLRIHLKRKQKKEGLQTYQDLPINRIQAPSVNSRFPMPIVKLEIPAMASLNRYKPKKYHKQIEPKGSNVVEIYLAHADFNMDAFMDKLAGMHLAMMVLSFEIFATNTVTTDYQKANNIIPKDGPKDVMGAFKILDDMQIIVVQFKDNNLDKKLSKVRATFIENELSEAILAMMQIRYPKTSDNGVYDAIYLGGASLRDVNQPTGPLVRPSIGTNNLISEAFMRDGFTPDEKEDLYHYALKLRLQLRDALLEHQQNLEEKRKQLYDKVTKFIKALSTVKLNRVGELEGDEFEWLQSHTNRKSAEVSLMVAKYLGMDECILYTRSIWLGSEQKARHSWLMYQDLFDIDASYSLLSDLGTMSIKSTTQTRTIPHYAVCTK